MHYIIYQYISGATHRRVSEETPGDGVRQIQKKKQPKQVHRKDWDDDGISCVCHEVLAQDTSCVFALQPLVTPHSGFV